MMTRPKWAGALVLVAVLFQFGAACTPEEVAVYRSLAPADQAKVVAALQDRQDQERRFYEGIIASRALSTDCVAAMQAVWPAHLHGWAMGIMRRESGLFHAADNPSSSAAGCWQMLAMHNWRYYEVGCSAADIYHALCNNRAAYHLYRQAGTSPWNL